MPNSFQRKWHWTKITYPIRRCAALRSAHWKPRVALSSKTQHRAGWSEIFLISPSVIKGLLVIWRRVFLSILKARPIGDCCIVMMGMLSKQPTRLRVYREVRPWAVKARLKGSQVWWKMAAKPRRSLYGEFLRKVKSRCARISSKTWLRRRILTSGRNFSGNSNPQESQPLDLLLRRRKNLQKTLARLVNETRVHYHSSPTNTKIWSFTREACNPSKICLTI